MKLHKAIRWLLLGCTAALLSACGQGSNEKKPVVASTAAEAAKPGFFASTQEKCDAAFRHMAYLAAMDKAPMNVSPEKIQYEIEKVISDPVGREHARKCVDFDYPNNLKNSFECMHTSKTMPQMDECSNRYDGESRSWEAANKAKIKEWEYESKKRLWGGR